MVSVNPEASAAGRQLAGQRRFFPGTCGWCGVAFMGTTRRRWCGNTCAKRGARRARSIGNTPKST